MSGPSRRDLLKGVVVLPLAAQLPPAPAGTRPLVIASANGRQAVEEAYRILAGGGDPVDAVVSGVNIVEDDPNDVTVGYGGIPNEEGVVELDASVMDGRTMKSGSVAALHHIKNPSKVARIVMEQTNRVMIVGEGALRFAKAHGFSETNLLTERARKIWLYWKENLSSRDDWIPSPAEAQDPDIQWYIDTYGNEDFRPQGTINCDCVTASGDLAGVTSTSGLFFKIPGRVGDSPVIGAGLYVDNEVGAAGSTGWGEGNVRAVGAHTVLELIRQGKTPQEACLAALERVVRLAREQKRDAKGRPQFSLKYYVVTTDGRYAGASVWSGTKSPKGEIRPAQFAVCDAKGPRLENCAYLYKRD